MHGITWLRSGSTGNQGRRDGGGDLKGFEKKSAKQGRMSQKGNSETALKNEQGSDETKMC